MFDVICIGEALVDFLPDAPGRRVADVERWTRCSGGSPANVAVGVARLGGSSAFLGCVGRDEFGDYLRSSLAAEGVDVSHVRQTAEGRTGLVFISLTAGGDRSFSFHRTRSAELFLGARDVDPEFLSRTRAIHVGTNSLLWPEAQQAALEMVRIAASREVVVCSDPNLRLAMWEDPSELRRVVHRIFASTTVAKLSEDETEFVTDMREPDPALRAMRELGVTLPIVTLAERGAALLWKDEVLRVPAPSAKVVDTTGAGDGFMAGLLYGLTRRYGSSSELGAATADDLRELAAFGCRVGSKVVEHVGAVAALPRRGDVS